MADIRGIPTTPAFLMGRLVALAGAPAGFTVGARYWPLALGIDCAPVLPVLYVLTADDTGKLVTVAITAFTWRVDNLSA